jgi:hypothetical protein
MKRLLSYGQSNFEQIRKENCYFVDKTKYIQDLETVRYPVFLRPRRFGKTLFTEILRCYYDFKMADQFELLFGGLYIGENPTPKRNSYYFLSFNFSGLSAGESMAETIRSFNRKIYDITYDFLVYYQGELKLESEEKKDFMENAQADASAALRVCVNAVKRSGGKLFVAIDEYDSLTNALALQCRDSYDEASEYSQALNKGGFFRAFFEALKEGTSKSVDQVYITGILPITISDMNSGFNIASFITANKDFTNMLGLTETELGNLYDEISLDYDLPLSKDDCLNLMRRYYNGYCFLPTVEEKVYNPMMSLYFLNHLCRHGEIPKNLTDHNLRTQYDQVSYIFGLKNEKRRDEIIESLTEKGEIEQFSDIDVVFNMQSIQSGEFAVEGLYYLGLLTWKYADVLQIPNLVTYEMVLSYFEHVQQVKPERKELGPGVIAYKRKGDIKAFCESFFKAVIQKFPGAFFRDANESFYRGLFFHILYDAMEKTNYDVYSEFQALDGQVDFYIKTHPEAKVPCTINDVIEIKRVKSSATASEFNSMFKEAVKQAEARCCGDLQNCRPVAICFRGNKDYKICIENKCD